MIYELVAVSGEFAFIRCGTWCDCVSAGDFGANPMTEDRRNNSDTGIWWLAFAIVLALGAGLAFGANLPDHAKTPGVVDPAMTADILCAKKFTTRDTRNVSAAMKREVYAHYRMMNHKGACKRSKRGCEVDHLISLELGGANHIGNLWPQPFGKSWGAEIKDRLENAMHRLVCAGQITLEQAQQEISTDWIAAYRKYMQ